MKLKNSMDIWKLLVNNEFNHEILSGKLEATT